MEAENNTILHLGTPVYLNQDYPGGWYANTIYSVAFVKTCGGPHVNDDTPVLVGRTGSDKTLEVKFRDLIFPEDAEK